MIKAKIYPILLFKQLFGIQVNQIDRLRLWTGDLCYEASAGIWDTVPYPDHLKLKWNDYSSRDKIKVTQAIDKSSTQAYRAVRRLADVVPYILSLDLSEKMKLWLAFIGVKR